MKRAVMGVFLAVAFFSGIAEAFTSANLEAFFDVPSDWKVSEYGPSPISTTILAPVNADGTSARKWTLVLITLRGTDAGSIPQDLAAAAADLIRQKNAPPDDEWDEPALPQKLVSQEETQFAGLPAMRMVFMLEPGTPQERRSEVFLVLKEGRLFTFNFFCRTGDLEIDGPGAKRIIESFKFSSSGS